MKQNKTRQVLRSLALKVIESKSKSGMYPRLTSLPSDAWGRKIKYTVWHESGEAHFSLGSPGRDGYWEFDNPSKYRQHYTEPEDFDADIVFVDDVFVRFPLRMES